MSCPVRPQIVKQGCISIGRSSHRNCPHNTRTPQSTLDLVMLPVSSFFSPTITHG
ncbi:uncharacterized protein B0H18DRAFT_1010993 [Fomitopsis serialis]|uniref:uncharacterized protein n=1 Tax=Fomitopsis serialis TaxID=139415 RepID=UPI002007DA29|nr:uncharacterized protein B0H18DRAFT_1010993 [Neoantrodia serialis]KAH9924738.1 hypothetical protein B0H18DRAFT_1010993 [Neoantrodia serialis]